MLTVGKLLARGQGLAPALLRRASTVELDWDVRQKSRFEATDSRGRRLAVFLPRGTVARGGDVLVAEDGSLVRVVAAAQPVMVITACEVLAVESSPRPSPGGRGCNATHFDLLRAAYHLGNRHVPIELQPDHLKIEPDHVLADMLRSMHLIVREANEAFEPEGGAYGAGHGGHGHGHGPGQGDNHRQGDNHGHDHGHSHGHGHGHDGHRHS